VVAVVDLPLGEQIRPELMGTELRPSDNIALLGGYAFSELDELVGKIARVPISAGQAILEPMVAPIPNDLAPSGSDLALLVEQGRVAVAFSIDRFSGIAYTLRPGDFIDVLMTLRIIDVDPEFNSALPNLVERVNNDELLAGRQFLFPKSTQGRLEFLPNLGQTVEFIPSDQSGEGQGQGDEVPAQISRRVTQLTIQQAEVLWVGTWRDPREFEDVEVPVIEDETGTLLTTDVTATEGAAAPTPVPERFENAPDVIILSMLSQDALALKWASDRGIDIDLALRAQGDTTVFVTSGVSLPQIIDQGLLTPPEPTDIDLEPRTDKAPIPSLPPNPPSN
jgi:hypothetical protein